MKKLLIICTMVSGLFLTSCSSNNETTATATDSTATLAVDTTTVATATDTVATDSAACPMMTTTTTK